LNENKQLQANINIVEIFDACLLHEPWGDDYRLDRSKSRHKLLGRYLAVWLQMFTRNAWICSWDESWVASEPVSQVRYV